MCLNWGQMHEGVRVTERKTAKKLGLVSGLMMDQVEDPAIVLLDDLERLFQFGLTFFLFHLSEGFL